MLPCQVVPPPLNVHLEQYEGPLDLLLDLIRKQQINIYDIPIARITSQYLEYVQKAADLDMELSSEFVYMASTLIHIKSKLLLPRDPELEKMDPEGDPRAELVDRLLEHERFKNAAEMLQQKRLLEEAAWSNPAYKEFLSDEEEPALAVTLFDLVQTLQKVLDRAKSRPQFEVTKEDVTVPGMIGYLHSVLVQMKAHESVSAAELFEKQRTRSAMIVLFLAILEMVKNQAVTLVQMEAFGDIGLKRHKNFEEFAANSETLQRLEEDYK
ncbi:MAG: chromosome segregation protein ScpA [Acidobacteria bacterium]|nr:chromosome segregation protein ScpA [Acidobacteriota bacterium]